MSGEVGRIVGEVVDLDRAGGGFLLKPDDGGVYVWVNAQEALSATLGAGARVVAEGTLTAPLDENDLRRLAADSVGLLDAAS